MRHQTKGHKLGRTHSHRKATLAALSTALIQHKRITTTVSKARALRIYVEPLINRAKEDTTNNRRQVFRRLQSKDAVKELFGDVAEKITDRPGGYTRVIKLGNRLGDGTEMAMVELVDYNDTPPEGAGQAGRRRRTRRSAGRTRRSPKAQGSQSQTTAATATATAPGKQTDASEGTATGAVETPVVEEQEVPVPDRAESPESSAPDATGDSTDDEGDKEEK